MPGAVSMRTLYLRSGIARGPGCTVLHVTPLLRELIVEAVRLGDLKIRNPLHRALRELIAAQVNAASSIPTSLAMPHDTRALALAQDTIRVTRQTKPLHSQCRRLGLSVRTMQRIFRREVGIDFETWRRQARLMKAVELLAQGRSVKEVSFAVGYRQPGSFVTLFRETFGTTPKAWIAALNV
jgi:transcriptional regulator GlxA family with amidase domain